MGCKACGTGARRGYWRGGSRGGGRRPAGRGAISDMDRMRTLRRDREVRSVSENKQKWCNHGATSAQRLRAWTAGVSRGHSCALVQLRLRPATESAYSIYYKKSVSRSYRSHDAPWIRSDNMWTTRAAPTFAAWPTQLCTRGPARDAMARRWAMRRARAHAQQATPRGGTTARPAPGRGPWAPLRHQLTGLYHPLRHCAAIESNTATPAPSRGPSLSILVHVLLAAGGDGLALVHGVRLDGRARRDLHVLERGALAHLREGRGRCEKAAEGVRARAVEGERRPRKV